mmetsp:Transcript_29095/g.49746  ORF Transcript_29095/g.49746 Transcript_29095/m.49746 type:complete len:92 (+) Transcript_29095:37-312(+)
MVSETTQALDFWEELYALRKKYLPIIENMLQFLDWNSWGPEGGEAHRRVVMIYTLLLSSPDKPRVPCRMAILSAAETQIKLWMIQLKDYSI